MAVTELVMHRIVGISELTALFTEHEIMVEPPEATRLLRALTLSPSRPLAEPLDAARIVEVFVHRVGGRS